MPNITNEGLIPVRTLLRALELDPHHFECCETGDPFYDAYLWHSLHAYLKNCMRKEEKKEAPVPRLSFLDPVTIQKFSASCPKRSKEDIYETVNRYLTGDLEGRPLQSLANQIIGSESALLTRRSPKLLTEILEAIVALCKVKNIRLNLAKTRFGIVIPKMEVLPVITYEELCHVWDRVAYSVCKTHKFAACVNFIRNSYGPWKLIPNQEKLASVAVIGFLQQGWI